MMRQTKIFLALLILVIGGGIAYWKWQEGQEPTIEVTGVNRTNSSIDVSFKMAYQGIVYTDAIKYPTMWKRTKRGYTFEVISKDGSVYFFIKDKDGSILGEKKVKIV